MRGCKEEGDQEEKKKKKKKEKLKTRARRHASLLSLNGPGIRLAIRKGLLDTEDT